MSSRTKARAATTGSVVVALVVFTACVQDDPGLPPLSCDAYCSEVLANCSANPQYRSTAECKKVCAYIDLGTSGDTGVNTIGCRLTKTRQDKSANACAIAGPFGGGVCGNSRCDTFCAIAESGKGPQALGICTKAPYGAAGCTETCTQDPHYQVTPGAVEGTNGAVFPGVSKNDFNCRSFHLILALGDATTHCPHTGIDSATCKL